MRATAIVVVMLSLTATVAVAFGGSASSPPCISVNRSDALWDTPLKIGVSHLPPHQRGELRATARDDLGKLWISTTRVHADGGGGVDLAGDSAMRVLWSMHPPSAGPADYYVYAPPNAGAQIRLAVSVAGRVVCAVSVRRRLRAPGERVRELRPAREGFYGEMFEPKTARVPGPAVLVFGGSEGGLATSNLASLLAARGYPTLALAYFGEPGLPKNLVRIPLEYFARALRWLAAQPGVDSARVAVVGISRGSEAAQLLGVHDPSLVHAVVALVPSNTANCGIPRFTGTNRVRCIGPAWTLPRQGDPLQSHPEPVRRRHRNRGRTHSRSGLPRLRRPRRSLALVSDGACDCRPAARTPVRLPGDAARLRTSRSWRRPPVALRPVLPPDRRLDLRRSTCPRSRMAPPARIPQLAPIDAELRSGVKRHNATQCHPRRVTSGSWQRLGRRRLTLYLARRTPSTLLRGSSGRENRGSTSSSTHVRSLLASL